MPSHLTFKKDSFCLNDQLGFDRYVQILGEMITDKNFQTPFCIGIHGSWGSGKTSFMRQLEANLTQNNNTPVAVPVWFNPWRYSKEEHLIIPFLKTIAASLNTYHKSNDDPLSSSLKKAASEISTAARAIAYGAKVDFFGLALSGKDMIDQEANLKKKEMCKAVVLTEELPDIYYGIIDHLQDAVKEKEFRLVVFIDDLDRCIPEKAVELLEAIKLFLDLEGYLFILGVDRKVVEEGILHHYKYRGKDEGDKKPRTKEYELAAKYLEKMIQMPLELPPVEPSRKRGFIYNLLENSSLQQHSTLIEYGIAGRPRDITRFINYLAFFCRLAENLKDDLAKEPENSGKPDNWKNLVQTYFSPEFYVKWAILVFGFRTEHSEIVGVTNYFFKLQKAARASLGEGRPEEAKREEAVVRVPERLGRVLAYGDAFAEEPWLIRKYVHLADSVSLVVASEVKAALPSISGGAAGRVELPVKGEMVLVTRGPFMFGDDKRTKNIEQDFEIDIYPVTNAQFCEFLNEWYPGGKALVTDKGKAIIELKWSRVEHNNYGVAGGNHSYTVQEKYADHPVVTVSLHGAENFCKWRTCKFPSPVALYRLPTQLEWEKAARGDGGNEYPWGNEFDPSKCNTRESGKKDTTGVTEHPQGQSPYGCFDMAGNVWEWTSTDFDLDRNAKILRGGSWDNDRAAARCASRNWFLPDLRYFNTGFRCARTIQWGVASVVQTTKT